MLLAGDAVRAFLDDAELYLDCLKVQESLMPPNELSARKQAVMAQQHNDAVADMQRLATTYNAAVRAYKGRTVRGATPASSPASSPQESSPASSNPEASAGAAP